MSDTAPHGAVEAPHHGRPTPHVPLPTTERPWLRLARAISERYHIPGYSAEDVAQEAALEATRAEERHRQEPRGHLLSFVRNRVRAHLGNLLRSARRRLQAEADQSAAEQAIDHRPGPERVAESNEALDLLWTTLPPREAAVIQGEFWDEDTRDEIAARLRVDRETVSAYRKRALARLRARAGGSP